MTLIDEQLHERIHRQMMDVDPDEIFGPRVGVFDQVEKLIGTRIHGSVLDVGCGNGYAAIWLARHRDVSEVVALEGSPRAVEELIPRNVRHHDVDSIVVPTLGSFDALGMTDRFDFVVAFGAIHHSTCLWSTMASLAQSLKPGGYLVAQEPVMPNSTSNQRYLDKYDVIESKFGLDIRNGDRDDHFFREAEYVTAGVFNSLDLIEYVDFVGARDNFRRGRLWGLLRRLKRRFLGTRDTAQTGESGSVAPYTQGLAPKIFVFRKAPVAYVPHLWRPLQDTPDR